MQGIFSTSDGRVEKLDRGEGGNQAKDTPKLEKQWEWELIRAQWPGWGVCRIWTHFHGSSGCWSNRARQLLDTEHQEEGGTETPISPAQPLVSTSGPL